MDRKLSIISLALLVGLVVLSLAYVSPIRPVAAANRTITLVGFFQGWNATTVSNPTITVSQGDVVTLKLSSGDGITHQWFVDVDKNGPAPDCPGMDICSSAFATSMNMTFTVSFSPGTYTYYCAIHPTTMVGSFVVNPSTTVGGVAQTPNKLVLIMPYLALASALAIALVIVAYLKRSTGSKTREAR
ncbi:MAG TPA: plastocyanin/azurin family copper-binding protein [Candidatus Dormibacteraeota bacterium]|jgi:plastocyanin|nr:plastocyanin/azurin family copper-binding protein [Candidatus Dormibacteraeota bacterium]